MLVVVSRPVLESGLVLRQPYMQPIRLGTLLEQNVFFKLMRTMLSTASTEKLPCTTSVNYVLQCICTY